MYDSGLLIQCTLYIRNLHMYIGKGELDSVNDKGFFECFQFNLKLSNRDTYAGKVA